MERWTADPITGPVPGAGARAEHSASPRETGSLGEAGR